MKVRSRRDRVEGEASAGLAVPWRVISFYMWVHLTIVTTDSVLDTEVQGGWWFLKLPGRWGVGGRHSGHPSELEATQGYITSSSLKQNKKTNQI